MRFCYLHDLIKPTMKLTGNDEGQTMHGLDDQYPDRVGVIAPREGDMLKGAKTFFALQTRHARSVDIVSKMPSTLMSRLTPYVPIRLNNFRCKFNAEPIT